MSQQQKPGAVPRIVVGVDGSASSQEALRWAIRQAGLTGSTVTAVIAWHLPLLLGGFSWPAAGGLESTDFAKLAGKVLTDAIDATVGPGHLPQLSTAVRQGNAAEVLLREAAGAELLVVGRRGHDGFSEALLGSVSQHCVHHASCPVVIIRGGDREMTGRDPLA